MESEKVKKIKKALECWQESVMLSTDENYVSHKVYNREILDYINELESENERLNKSDTSKEESSIEYYNLYKDLKRKNKDLNELCELQRVSIAESFVRENQLKDRIAELEKENAELKVDLKNSIDMQKQMLDGFKTATKEVELNLAREIPNLLKQFAERLKEDFTKKKNKLIKEREIAAKCDDFILIDALVYKIDELQYAIDKIDETLKEFIK